MKGIGYAMLAQVQTAAILTMMVGAEGRPRCFLRTKVGFGTCFLPSRSTEPLTGAAHLYLLDFVEDNLANLKSTIEQKYPDVKVDLPNDQAPGIY